jgi:PIN domain nuclease of toxin-antitoxin system
VSAVLPLLLDTCAVIWLAQGEALAKTAVDALRAANDRGLPTYVSPMTAWEVGQLVARNRLTIYATPSRWFADVLERGASIAELSPDVLIASSFLPGRPPRDPADRIIVATARDVAATIVTRDRALLDYGRQGHVGVVEC